MPATRTEAAPERSRRPSRHREAPLRRWLRADLADLVEVSGPRDGSASAPPAEDSDAVTFDGDLRALRRRIVRRWALAVAARYALVALAVAAVPAALAAFDLIAPIWAPVIGAAVFVVAVAARLLRAPTLAEVARLLDDRLGLFDVTATALQVERSGEPVDEGPAAPVFAEAAALLRAGATAWRPRSRLGRRELLAGGGLVAVLAAIAVAGVAGNGSASREVATNATSARGRHGAAEDLLSPPLARPKVRRHHARPGAAPNPAKRRPFGLYNYGFEGKRVLPKYEQKRPPGLRYAHGAPRSQGKPQFSAPGIAEGNEAREKAEEEATKAGAGPRPSSEGQRGREAPPQSLKSLTGGQAPPSGSVRPVPNSSSGAPPSASKSGAAAPSDSAGAGQRGAPGAARQQGGGRPSGSAEAGHERAALNSGERGRDGGEAGAALSLKAGFAAAKAGKPAKARGPRDAQGGGGPGRAAGVGGSAFEEAEAGSLGYVPPDAGVAPGVDPGLFNRYLNALARIGARRW